MVDIDGLYRRWVSEYGEKGVVLKYPSLKGLYQWFLRECANYGIDPTEVDFESLVDPTLVYSENQIEFKKYFPSIPVPEKPEALTKEELEKALAMYEEEANNIKKELGLPLTDIARIDELEGKLADSESKFERTREQLKKAREEAARLEKELVQAKEKPITLTQALEEQKRYSEQLKERLDELSKTTLSEEEYRLRMAELEKRAKELADWEKELTAMQFQATQVPAEELEKMLKRVMKPQPLPKPERIVSVYKPSEEEGPPEGGAPEEAPEVELPKKPLSPLPFPRAPTSEERAVLYRAYEQILNSMGIDPWKYLPTFNERITFWPFRNWDELIAQFNETVQDISTGKPARMLKIPPMPWRQDQRRYDATIHFIATKIYKTMDELIDALTSWGVPTPEEMMAGVPKVSPEEVKEAAKKAWREKNVWFTSVSKEFLESLIEEKIE